MGDSEHLVVGPLAPTPAVVVHQRLVERWRDVLAALDVVADPAPEGRQWRTWSPMDGAQPPWCPFVDEYRATQTVGDLVVELSTSAPHWNDQEPSDPFVLLTVMRAGVAVARWWGRRAEPPGTIDGWCADVLLSPGLARLAGVVAAALG